MELDKPFPDIRFRVRCSKGTYIRTLCVDIGKALGYPAVMAELVRTSTGNITLSECLTFEQIERLNEEGSLQEYLIPMEKAVSHLPSVVVAVSYMRIALQGQKLKNGNVSEYSQPDGTTMAVYSPDKRLIGFYRVDEQFKQLVPVKIFSDFFVPGI
jgi:tRNA pseudouridine55 synthase